MKEYLKFLSKEIVPVIMGILIALFINNWNEERKEKKYFDEILNSIEHELEETQEDVEARIVAHSSTIDTIYSYLEDEVTTIQDIMTKTNGITIPKIRIHSWKALSNSKIELLDYKSLSSLAEIEEEKSLLRDKSQYLMNFLYNNIGERTRRKKGILMGLVRDVIGTENWILSEVNDLNERLKAKK